MENKPKGRRNRSLRYHESRVSPTELRPIGSGLRSDAQARADAVRPMPATPAVPTSDEQIQWIACPECGLEFSNELAVYWHCCQRHGEDWTSDHGKSARIYRA
jgi:hypothetical protein